MFWVDLS